jgi:MFS family permease
MKELEPPIIAPDHLTKAHPVVFMFLVLPFGVVAGYIQTTYEYLFTQAGISIGLFAAVVAAGQLPQSIKFLWAPLIDTSLSLKKWYIISSILTSATMLMMGFLPIKESSLFALTVISVLSNVAVSFLGMAVNGLAAHATSKESQGKAGGYLQAGNLGGAGVGGGIGLWLAEHTNNLLMSGILAGACLLCSVALFYVHEPKSTVRAEKISKTLKNLFADIWGSIKSRLGFLALFLCFLPLGTGAASGLWAGVAGDWHASPATVEFVTGIMGGLITAAGCLVGGWLCDRMNRQMAYVVFGFISAICAVGMAYCPHSELMYIIWTSVYAFSLGLCYAAFSAFALEAIGKGAAATKFTVYASLSNIPIAYMTSADGWAYTKYGPNGMLYIEAIAGVIGVVLFLGLLKYVNSRKATAIA